MNLSHLTFDPPGPGSWSIDNVHFSRPYSRFHPMHPPNLIAGFTDCMRRYGLLLETLDCASVNGFAYSRRGPLRHPKSLNDSRRRRARSKRASGVKTSPAGSRK